MTHKELIQNLRICGKGGNCLGCELDGKCSGINSILTDAADRLEALRTENDQLREAMKMMPKWRPASEPPEEYRDEYDELQCFLVCAEHCVEPFREEAVCEYRETVELRDWLRKMTNWDKIGKYTLDQLRAVRGILGGANDELP